MLAKKFDTLLEDVLRRINEAPVTGGPEFVPSLRTAIDTAPGGGYLIGHIAKSLNKSKQEIIDMIGTKLFDKVFGQYPDNVNPAKNEDQYRNSIKAALTEIIQELKEQNPNMKVPGADAVRGYTARVISQLGQATKDYTGGVSGSEQTVKTAVRSAASTEGAKTVAAKEEPKAFRASSTVDYTFEPEVKIGLLNDEELRIYDAVDKSSAYSGRELIDYLKDEVKLDTREDLNVSRITRILNSLIKKDIISVTAKPSEEGDVEALLSGGEDMERVEKDTFERELGAAWRDAVASDPSRLSGREEGY